jgi:hypothetical protein
VLIVGMDLMNLIIFFIIRVSLHLECVQSSLHKALVAHYPVFWTVPTFSRSSLYVVSHGCITLVACTAGAGHLTEQRCAFSYCLAYQYADKGL